MSNPPSHPACTKYLRFTLRLEELVGWGSVVRIHEASSRAKRAFRMAACLLFKQMFARRDSRFAQIRLEELQSLASNRRLTCPVVSVSIRLRQSFLTV
jgi:hypothetical protein